MDPSLVRGSTIISVQHSFISHNFPFVAIVLIYKTASMLNCYDKMNGCTDAWHLDS